MAKEHKYATVICICLSIAAIVGIIIGIIFKSPLAVIICLLPTVIYEIYRTEGKSTKGASWGMLFILIAEAVLILFNISFNLAEWLGQTEKYFYGYLLPLGDIKIVAPAIMAVLSVLLFTRTWGIYTKWLAVIIFITSFALIYTIDPAIFESLLKLATEESLNRI